MIMDFWSWQVYYRRCTPLVYLASRFGRAGPVGEAIALYAAVTTVCAAATRAAETAAARTNSSRGYTRSSTQTTWVERIPSWNFQVGISVVL